MKKFMALLGSAVWASLLAAPANASAGTQGFASQTVSIAAPRAAVSISMSSWAPERNTAIVAKVCWAHATPPDLVQIEQAEGTEQKWKPIMQARTSSATGCASWSYRAQAMGKYPMRAQLLHGRSKRLITPVKDLKVYGHIAGVTFWSNVVQTGSGCGGTVSNGVHTYQYFTAWGISCWLENTITFATTNTCRHVVFVMLSTDNAQGDPSSDGVSTVTVTQGTLNPETATFDDNVATSAPFALDGSVAELTAANTNGSGNGSAIYFLDNSYADCLTQNGD
jgi:hypothetical protein